MKVEKFRLASHIVGVISLMAAAVAPAQDGRISTRVTRPVGIAGTAEIELALPLVAPNPALVGKATLSFDGEEDPPAQSFFVGIEEGGDFENSIYSLFIQDGSGTLQLVGVLEGTGGSGSFEINDASEPLELEAFLQLLEVEDFSQLQLRMLEIRVGGTPHMVGAVPLLGSQTLCNPPSATQIVVKGRLDIARKGTRSTINLRIEGVDVLNSAYRLFVETAVGSDDFQFVSAVEPVRRRVVSIFDNVIAYRVDTSKGESLPANVFNLDDLAGRRYFVLQDEDLKIAEGLFPAIPVPGAPTNSVKISAPLVQPESFVPDSTARGWVELRSDARTGRQYLQAKVFMRYATNFANGDGRLFFEIAPGSRVFNEVACFFDVVAGSRLRIRIPISTATGEALPLGALSLNALTGRRMQVRDPGGLVFLEGFMPTLPTPGTKLGRVQVSSVMANVDPLNFPSAECRATMRFDQRTNAVRFSITTLGLRGGPVFEIWMTDPRTGSLAFVANLNWPNVTEFLVDTQKGQALPFGILDPNLLSGLALEIREQGASTVLAGNLPILP